MMVSIVYISYGVYNRQEYSGITTHRSIYKYNKISENNKKKDCRPFNICKGGDKQGQNE